MIEEMLREDWNLFGPVPQRWDVYSYNIKPVKQVFSESPFVDGDSEKTCFTGLIL